MGGLTHTCSQLTGDGDCRNGHRRPPLHFGVRKHRALREEHDDARGSAPRQHRRLEVGVGVQGCLGMPRRRRFDHSNPAGEVSRYVGWPTGCRVGGSGVVALRQGHAGPNPDQGGLR